MQFKVNSFTDFKKRLFSHNIIVYIALVIIFAFFALTLGSTFVSVNNILNITRQTAMISIMAVAMTFVISAGLIDLSIGSTAAMSAMMVSVILRETNSIALALAGGIAVGVVVGLANGLLITKAKIPAFLTTLGMMGIVRGFAMWITNTAAVPILNPNFNFIFGTGNIAGIPVLLYWTVVFGAVGYFMLNKIPFGKHVLATGGNETAARFSGVNTDRIKIAVMVLSGAFAAFAGILYAGRMQAGRFTFGEGDELSVIAAVIIGGTSMAGGTGAIIGAITGSFLMGIINNGLILAGFTVSQQMIIRGAIIILAVAIGSRYSHFKSNKSAESRKAN
ncbi:MAG: ABC transporter permease [Defluviitaleaceae bacterium]|nr:ABC transporter permease [Defluviitaleaceae bacterium]